MRALTIVWTAALLGLACALAGAGEEGAPARLADLRLGEHWAGVPLQTAQLEGQVVLFVLWGS